MTATGIGAPVRRTEDHRFITGRGHYTDDINRPGQAYAVCHDASKFAVKSLDSIRWNNDRVFFAGPYVRR